MGAALALVAIAATVTAIAVTGRFQTDPLAVAAPPDYRAVILTDRLPLPLNPLVDAEDPGVSALWPLLYRPLLSLDANALPAPDLSTGLTISPDGLTYSLPLQAGQRWSNGNPITAHDALATIGWVESPTFPDPSYAAAWQGVEASVSGSTLTLQLARPRASLAATLTELPVLPLGNMTQAQLKALPGDSAFPLPSSGPYLAVGERSGVISLSANPHAASPPHLARVDIQAVTSFAAAAQAFASGSASAALATTPAERAELLRRRGATARDTLTFGFVDLLFNERIPGLSDPAVRQAVADSVDRAQIVGGPLAGFGVAQYGPIPAGIGWLESQQPAEPVDVTAASAALDKAGWRTGQDGVRRRAGVALQLTLSVPDAAPLPEVARMVATQLGAVGILVTVSVAPSPTFLNSVLIPGDFQLAIAAWDPGPDPDLTAYWASTASPPDGYNLSGGPVDPFLDQDLATLATVSDQSQRTAAAARVVSDMGRDVPAVFLYAPEESLVVAGRLSQVEVPPMGDPLAQAASWRR